MWVFCLVRALWLTLRATQIDEWWFPPPPPPPPLSNNNTNTSSSTTLSNALASVLRTARGREFCFLTFPSFIMHGHDAHWASNTSNLAARTAHPRVDFAFRDGQPNYVYRKSIARVDNAFIATSHVFGSCRGALEDTYVLPETRVGVNDGCWKSHCGVSVPQWGAMHHFYALFHNDDDRWKNRAGVLLPKHLVKKWAVDLIVRDEFAM